MVRARRHRFAVGALVSITMAFGLVACSGGDDTDVAGPQLPAGTELGEWGESLQVEDSIQLVLGDKAGGTSGTVVRLQVVDVRKGTAEDLGTFTGVPSQSVSWYVSVAQHNRGPADLVLADENGWFLRLDDDVELPPTKVQGKFRDCPSDSAEETLLVAADRLDCLVFLVPETQRPESVDYLRYDGIAAVHWRVPSSVGTES